MRATLVSAILFACFAGVSRAQTGHPHYMLVPIPGGSVAAGINTTGQVVGYTYDGVVGRRAFSWTEQTGIVFFFDGFPDATDSEATTLNDAGVVIGQVTVPAGRLGFQWSQQSGVVLLPDLPGGYVYAKPFAISGSGVVGGASTMVNNESFTRAVTWTNAATPVTVDDTLTYLNSGSRSVRGIHPDGTLLLTGSSTDWGVRSSVKPPNAPEIGLPDLPGGSDGALARAWNNYGFVVGSCEDATSGGQGRPCFWNIGGNAHAMSNTVPGLAQAVNDFGTAVGYRSPSVGFVWTRCAGLADLDTLVENIQGRTITRASGINDAGVIAVTFEGLGDGAGILVPVPVAGVCDCIDFNNDGLFPDTTDLDDFLSVFSGGPCSTNTCGDIDFNNDGLFPDTTDIDALLSVFSGGPCLL